MRSSLAEKSGQLPTLKDSFSYRGSGMGGNEETESEGGEEEGRFRTIAQFYVWIEKREF